MVALPHWGLMRAHGEDAQTFLQGQLTNDVAQLGPHEVRLAGFCSAKGRLQASFLVWRAGPDDWRLACAQSVLPATLKRLSMFVLRARCRLSDVTPTAAMMGAVGPSADRLAGDTPVWSHAALAAGWVLRLPDAMGLARCVVVGAADAARDAGTPALSLVQWQRLEVQCGIPTIEAATVDQFVPQMLNYELVGGVDFRKGCYPGQEVVARSQYRGTIKRRMFLFETAGPAAPGQEVFHSADASQPAGLVVNAAPTEDGRGSWALVEVKLDTLGAGSLHLDGVHGAALRRGTLPYEASLLATLAA